MTLLPKAGRASPLPPGASGADTLIFSGGRWLPSSEVPYPTGSLRHWYAADEIAGAVVGGPVASWPSIPGVLNPAPLTVPGGLGAPTAPIFRTDGDDGLPYVEFVAASNRALRVVGGSPVTQDQTVLAVVRLQNGIGNSKVLCALAAGQGPTNERCWSAQNTTAFGEYVNFTGRVVGTGTASDTAEYARQSGARRTAHIWQVVMAIVHRLDGAVTSNAIRLWQNQLTGLGTGGPHLNAFEWTTLSVGGEVDAGTDDTTNYANCHVREFLIWDRALTVPEQILALRRAIGYWSIPVL